MIGADSLGYMKLEYLEGMAGGLPLCRACFDGNYPTEIPKAPMKNRFETKISMIKQVLLKELDNKN